jgi:hypothetical protein
LQWRAKHLRESIGNLLSGGNEDTETGGQVSTLVGKIYNDPLLKNVNQGATGLISLGFRRLTWAISGIYGKLFRNQPPTFGNQRSGPSYISSETFATTLLETLDISKLVEKLVEYRLEKFSQRILNGMSDIATKSQQTIDEKAFQFLQEDYVDTVHDFKTKEATLLISIDRLSESLESYIRSYPIPQDEDTVSKFFLDRMKAYKLSLFGQNNERAILAGGLQPTITEIVDALNTTSRVHQEIKTAFGDENSETYKVYKQIEAVLTRTPAPLKESLGILARRAQTRKDQAESELSQLRNEVAVWFDRSMSRASGVYKRNAKGVAILIGVTIAITANADTLHIFNRLSSDENLRKVITDRASQVSTDNAAGTAPLSQESLEKLKDQTDAVLKDIALPVSWNPVNLTQQFGCTASNDSNSDPNVPQTAISKEEWESLFQRCLPTQKSTASDFIPQKILTIAFNRPFAALRMVFGWLVSGIAIAMGAPFWFDLLGKVVNVRNSGSKPPVATPTGQK